MSSAVDIAKQYFDASNDSSFERIGALLKDSTTYSSQNTGMYLGKDSILSMQSEFHSGFAQLAWSIESVHEDTPGIVVIDYIFSGTKQDDSHVDGAGTETIVVVDGAIQHIEIRSKS